MWRVFIVQHEASRHFDRPIDGLISFFEWTKSEIVAERLVEKLGQRHLIVAQFSLERDLRLEFGEPRDFEGTMMRPLYSIMDDAYAVELRLKYPNMQFNFEPTGD